MTEELEAYYARVTSAMESEVCADCDSFVNAAANVGLVDTYQTFMQDVAGLYEIPVAMLYGNSPHASDGGGEMQVYYDHVDRQMRERLFCPFERALANIKAHAMRRGLYASRALKPGRNRRWRT